MDDHNKKRIQSLNDRTLFLLDTSAFQIFEDWGLRLGIDLLANIQESGTHYYFITNDVWVELHQKRSEG